MSNWRGMSRKEALLDLLSMWWKPPLWFLYAAIVFEIAFMISPFAIYFYSAYAPFLNFLGSHPSTAWLTEFFLPHFSRTSSPILEALSALDGVVLLAGLAPFAFGTVQIYGSKLFRRGRPVTGGLYRWIRHPQFLALAIMGIGVLLIWPRFLVLVGYITMLFIYYFLARHEERRCLKLYGESYRRYLERTGRVFPRRWLGWMPSWLPENRFARAMVLSLMYVVLTGSAVMAGFGLKSYSIEHISSYTTDDFVVLSPARIPSQHLEKAAGVVLGHGGVSPVLEEHGFGEGEKFLIYVVPSAWKLPHLPLEAKAGDNHHWPKEFDADLLKVLVARAVLLTPESKGLDIIKKAVKLEPILLVRLDLSQGGVEAVEPPPSTVRWGDAPTPAF